MNDGIFEITQQPLVTGQKLILLSIMERDGKMRPAIYAIEDYPGLDSPESYLIGLLLFKLYLYGAEFRDFTDGKR